MSESAEQEEQAQPLLESEEFSSGEYNTQKYVAGSNPVSDHSYENKGGSTSCLYYCYYAFTVVVMLLMADFILLSVTSGPTTFLWGPLVFENHLLVGRKSSSVVVDFDNMGEDDDDSDEELASSTAGSYQLHRREAEYHEKYYNNQVVPIESQSRGLIIPKAAAVSLSLGTTKSRETENDINIGTSAHDLLEAARLENRVKRRSALQEHRHRRYSKESSSITTDTTTISVFPDANDKLLSLEEESKNVTADDAIEVSEKRVADAAGCTSSPWTSLFKGGGSTSILSLGEAENSPTISNSTESPSTRTSGLTTTPASRAMQNHTPGTSFFSQTTAGNENNSPWKDAMRAYRTWRAEQVAITAWVDAYLPEGPKDKEEEEDDDATTRRTGQAENSGRVGSKDSDFLCCAPSPTSSEHLEAQSNTLDPFKEDYASLPSLSAVKNTTEIIGQTDTSNHCSNLSVVSLKENADIRNVTNTGTQNESSLIDPIPRSVLPGYVLNSKEKDLAGYPTFKATFTVTNYDIPSFFKEYVHRDGSCFWKNYLWWSKTNRDEFQSDNSDDKEAPHYDYHVWNYEEDPLQKSEMEETGRFRTWRKKTRDQNDLNKFAFRRKTNVRKTRVPGFRDPFANLWVIEGEEVYEETDKGEPIINLKMKFLAQVVEVNSGFLCTSAFQFGMDKGWIGLVNKFIDSMGRPSKGE